MSPPENTKQITLAKIKSGPLGYISPILSAFSTCPHPPSHIRLCSVGISHYVEKVRWVFTLSGTDYVEDAHPPGLASIATTSIEENTSATPIIKTETGEVVKKISTPPSVPPPVSSLTTISSNLNTQI
ncbi:hypothetical protein TL16_g06252 [Triparma laevis f. inornata]|uniref:Uncharacterized protein n=1 Tax=Triparma laevis f. inornata TaxID=1714386 RepID=A0A9W7AM99_9STRA|nr:hypothetical protein TL16_g06252 [Triparma laevis f. inornata]